MRIFLRGNGYIILILVMVSLVLSSCSLHVEKRKYRPGYHVNIAGSTKKINPTNKMVTPLVSLNRNHLVQLALSSDSVYHEPKLIPRVAKKKVTSSPVKNNRLLSAAVKVKYQDSCDVLYLAKGERLNVIVIEVGEDYVHYKMCDDPKGRLYTVKTKMIDNITFRNGEYFIPPDRIIVDKDKERKKSQSLFVMAIIAASIAFVALVLSFFIYPSSAISLSLAILDFLFSLILMLVNIKPTRFATSFRTNFTWILCALALLLVIAAMILVFV